MERIVLHCYSLPKSSIIRQRGHSGGKLPEGENSVRDISISSEVSNDNLDNIIINVEYTDSEISGLDEASITIYYWNGGSWVP